MITDYEIQNIVVPYLQEHLKIKWQRGSDDNAYLALELNSKVISKVKFEMD